MWSVSALTCLLALTSAPQVFSFVPPSAGGVIASPNFGRPSNGSLPKTKVVKGEVFDRFIQIWLENTDFEVAITSPVLQGLLKQGILLTNYHAVTHPSEPNYIAASGGDFFGLADDAFHAIPANVSTIVDLLEQKKISWASYQESMLSDGDKDFNQLIPNYLTNDTGPLHQFYVRKHNPFIIYDSIATVPSRAKLIRNFNDFAVDFNASRLPQWMFITPNLVDDGHDTDQNWIDAFLSFWLLPILHDKRFNRHRTLISLTYDENETGSTNNRVFHALLGSAIPKHLHGTVDDTFYTHFSLLSTAQRNWNLGCLGRSDTNRTLANVFEFVAKATGFQNLNVPNPPLTNISGTIPGPLNPRFPTPFQGPNLNAKCVGGGSVFVAGQSTSDDKSDKN